MEKLPREVYTTEFRQQAVEMITRDGLSIAEASRWLSISPKTLANWARWAKEGAAPTAGAGMPRRAVTEEEAELARLRRENAELRMERDILTMYGSAAGVKRSTNDATQGRTDAASVSGFWCVSLRLSSFDRISALATS